MNQYAMDVPAYVTLRVEARDAAHAMELVKAECVIDLGANAFILTEKTELSPGITLFPDGFDDTPSVTIYEESGAIAATPKTWTFWIKQEDGRGTTYVTSATADTLEAAREMALESCSADWGAEDYPVSSLWVIGVAHGSVQLVEWED